MNLGNENNLRPTTWISQYKLLKTAEHGWVSFATCKKIIIKLVLEKSCLENLYATN